MSEQALENGSSIEFDNRLIGAEHIAFLGKNPRDTAAIARGDVHLVQFDDPRNADRAGVPLRQQPRCAAQKHAEDNYDKDAANNFHARQSSRRGRLTSSVEVITAFR